MSSSSPRIVSVFGATGLQGGALISALLADGTFTPRAISRDPDSAASKQLKARGVEVVRGDPGMKDGLVEVLKGSEAVFAVTMPNVFTPDQPNEVAQGKDIVDAAKEAGVKFFVYSSLPNMTKLSRGKYTACSIYDDKASIQEYLESSGLPHASLLLPAFLENFSKLNMLKETPTGYELSLTCYPPEAPSTYVWVARDVPAAVLALLKNYNSKGKEIVGKAFPVVTGRLTHEELARMVGGVLGKEVKYVEGPKTGMPVIDEMWTALAEYSGLYTDTPIANPDLVKLGVELSSVEEFVRVEVGGR
ncbi:NmrA domain-containing protein [Favolaschia claudopus]|uniref:NmrA domain-containing protein n=1 Tax=Favolaschia claudopus TaxID=2862362 RepID=A0AAW0CSH6_9AGAR